MNRIKQLRNEKGFTQSELAKKLGVNSVTLSRYETGDRHPKIDKLVIMATIFGVSPNYIMGIEETNGLSEVTLSLDEYNRLKEIERKYNKIKSLVTD